MAALLSFVTTGPASAPTHPTPVKHAPTWKTPYTAGSTGVSASTCAAISASLAAVAAGQVRKGRKARKARSLRSQAVLHAFDPTKEVGAMDPLGYWDPLNLMKEGFKDKNAPYKSEDTFRWYRAAELKHGRVSMVALLGLLTASLTKFRGFEDVPDGWAALNTAQGGAGLGALILCAGILELDAWKQDPSKNPGDFGDPVSTALGDIGSDPGEAFWSYSVDMRNRELAHCRLAMSAVITSFLLEYGGVATETQFKLQSVPVWVKIGIACSFVAWITYTNDDWYIEDPRSAAQRKLLTSGGSKYLTSGSSTSDS